MKTPPYLLLWTMEAGFKREDQIFVNWVKDTLDKDENYELIVKSMNKETNVNEFGIDDYFLVFNYTHTLQYIYNISYEKIHYVHGECWENDDLIIGHGNDDRINGIEKSIKQFKEQYDYTQGHLNRINEYNCLLRFLSKLRKDVDRCKLLCESFYRKIGKNLDMIKVFGMSLGDVDIPYLKQIREKWPSAKWEFSYYSQDDKIRIIEVAEKILSINREKYEIFRFFNLIAPEIQEKIIELQNIKTHHKI